MSARPLAEVAALLLARCEEHRNPCEHMSPDDLRRVLAGLRDLDRDAWAAAFSAAAEPYEELARRAEAAGDAAAARQNLLLAYGAHRVARYPAANSPGKRLAYDRSRELFLRAARYADRPLERVEIPFPGRGGEGEGEGDRIVAYLHRPSEPAMPPLVIHWGGIDSFKEDRRVTPYVQRGLAVLVVDMPGTGEAPLRGSEDAERMWDPILDWAAGCGRFAAVPPALLGVSTGGYWATKLAHTHRGRISAAVNRGGPAHFAFEEEWIRHAQGGEYTLELAETLASAFGLETMDQWIAYAPRLSLLSQGILDGPSAPLLCVNGLDDSVFPIADHHLLLQHGEPKAARFYPGGHNAYGPHAREIDPMIAGWILRRLGGHPPV